LTDRFKNGGFDLFRFTRQSQMRQHHGCGENRAARVGQVFPRDRRRGAVDRLEHRSLPVMNIPAGSHAEASLQSRGKVGDDIAEHVVGDDDVELAWVADHLHAERVHIHVLGGDAGECGADLFEHPLPQTSGVSHGIRLVAH
jgi:hypothetical protein